MQSYDSGMLAFQDTPRLLPSDPLLPAPRAPGSLPRAVTEEQDMTPEGFCRPVEEVRRDQVHGATGFVITAWGTGSMWQKKKWLCMVRKEGD